MSSIILKEQGTKNRSKGIVTVICIGCKESFETQAYKVAIGRKYCGRECLANDKGFNINKIQKVSV